MHELQQALVNANWSHFNPETCRLMIGKHFIIILDDHLCSVHHAESNILHLQIGNLTTIKNIQFDESLVYLMYGSNVEFELFFYYNSSLVFKNIMIIDRRLHIFMFQPGMFDRDHSGTIDLQEFQGLWTYLSQWRGIFEQFDRDRSGTIDANELNTGNSLFSLFK